MNPPLTRPESLLAQYAELIDAGDFDAIGALFAEAIVTDPAGRTVAAGHEEVATLYRSTTRRFDDGTPRTKHLTSNTIVELSEDGTMAQARSYFVVFQKVDDGPLQPIVAGRYHDTLALVDGRWRFRERQMLPEMFGDVSSHLLFDASRIADPEEQA